MRTAARLLLALALLLSASASAQASLLVEVNAGYAGYYKRTAAAVPVRVRLRNDGPAFRATLQVDGRVADGRTRYSTEIDLPQGSDKVVTVYPPFAGLASNVSVTVLDGSRVVSSGSDQLREAPSDSSLYAVIASEPGPYLSLAVQRGLQSVEVAPITLTDIPANALALSSVDLLVVDGVDTSALTDAQRDALHAWVATGGHLLIGGGAPARETASGLTHLSPATPDAVYSTADLSALDTLGVSPAPRGTATLSSARPARGARVLSGADGRPLVATRNIGLGSVMWLAWSHSAPPFTSWPGDAQVLHDFPGQQASMPSLAGESAWMLGQFLQRITGVSLPPTPLIALFLLVYSLTLGPGLYLVLKRRDRREMAWVLIPLITVVFSLAAYGANFLVRGGGVTLKTLRVAESAQDADAQRNRLYVALFSTERRSYDLELPTGYSFGGPANPNIDPTTAAPSSPGQPRYTVRAGEAETLAGVAMDVYQLQQWSADSVTSAGGPVSATLSGDGRTLNGTVTNRGALPIIEGCVTYGDNAYGLPSLPQGGTESIQQSPCWQNVDSDELRNIALGLVGGYGPAAGPAPPSASPDTAIVVTWHKEPVAVKLRGATASSDGDVLTVTHVPVSLSRGAVSLQLPAAWRTEDAGVMRLTFRMPTGVQPSTLRAQWSAPKQGKMAVTGPAPGQPPFPDPAMPAGQPNVRQMEILNVQTHVWQQFPAAAQAPLGDAADYVSWDGVVQLRLTGTLEPFQAAGYTLTVEGRRE